MLTIAFTEPSAFGSSLELVGGTGLSATGRRRRSARPRTRDRAAHDASRPASRPPRCGPAESTASAISGSLPGERPLRQRHRVRGRATAQRLDDERARRRIAVREGDERVALAVGRERHPVVAWDRLSRRERAEPAREPSCRARASRTRYPVLPGRVRPERDLREPVRVDGERLRVAAAAREDVVHRLAGRALEDVDEAGPVLGEERRAVLADRGGLNVAGVVRRGLAGPDQRRAAVSRGVADDAVLIGDEEDDVPFGSCTSRGSPTPARPTQPSSACRRRSRRRRGIRLTVGDRLFPFASTITDGSTVFSRPPAASFVQAPAVGENTSTTIDPTSATPGLRHGGEPTSRNQPRAAESFSSASRRDDTPSFASRLFTCERTVCSEMISRCAISSVPRCWSSSSSTSSSRADTRARDRLGHGELRPAALAHLLEQPPCDRPRERHLALRDAAQEADDPLGRLALQQVAGGAARESRRAGCRRPRRRSGPPPRRSGAASRSRRQRLEAVHVRHRQVEHDQVGPKLAGERDRLARRPRPARPPRSRSRPSRERERLPGQGVVVDDQDARRHATARLCRYQSPMRQEDERSDVRGLPVGRDGPRRAARRRARALPLEAGPAHVLRPARSCA